METRMVAQLLQTLITYGKNINFARKTIVRNQAPEEIFLTSPVEIFITT